MIHRVITAATAAALFSRAAAFDKKTPDAKTPSKRINHDDPDFDFDELYASLPPSGTSDASGRGFSSTFLETSSAETTCEAEADSAFYDDFKNAYIQAVATVVKKSCSPKFDDVDRLKDDLVDFAFAWAEATASASANCESFTVGKAKTRGCAWSEASASAFQEAYAVAHAEAAASAFGEHCSCSEADAWDFAEAEIVVDLYAEVFASASALACSERNDKSSANAFVNCYAETLVDIYATAAAEASIKAGCTNTASKAKSLAKVRARKKPTETCTESVERVGRAEAKTEGKATAYAVRHQLSSD